MQRSALCAGAAALLVAGCASPVKTSLSRLPGPLLATGRRVAPPALPPPPPRRRLVPRPRARAPLVRLNTRALIPPGGIKRRRWRAIVVHHSASPNSTPAGMNRYHLSRGWSRGLGYHFVIGNGRGYPDGAVYVGRRWRLQVSGAHCRSARGSYFGRWREDNFFNAHGIGICLIGNFEQSDPTPRQLAALAQLIRFLCAQTGIDPAQVYGHGEVTHRTACPGRRLSMSRVRRSVNSVQAGTYH